MQRDSPSLDGSWHVVLGLSAVWLVALGQTPPGIVATSRQTPTLNAGHRACPKSSTIEACSLRETNVFTYVWDAERAKVLRCTGQTSYRKSEPDKEKGPTSHT